MDDTPGGLRRIIYTSHAQYLPNAEVAELYAASARRNRADDITGLLLYDGARFLQAIEGANAVVTATMARILHDGRHRHIHFVYHAAIAGRAFPSWSMTQSAPRPGGQADAFVNQVKRDVDALHDLQLQALFIGFARLAVTHRS